MTRFLKAILPFSLFRRLSMAYSVFLTALDSPSAATAMLWGEGERTCRFRRILHPFTFRLTLANRDVVMQNIVRGECVGGRLPASARFIVDGGGYIGDSAAVFLSLYPEAVCLVFEPSSNAELAVRNLAPYGSRAVVKQAMLSRDQGSFDIFEIGTGSRVFAVSDGDSQLKVATMDAVLLESPTGQIDILKLDIEGAEYEILRPPTPWLAAVRCLIIELHGDAAHRDIPGWLCAAGFTIERHRSLLFCSRLAK
jgi:FkbM family methyltransferase